MSRLPQTTRVLQLLPGLPGDRRIRACTRSPSTPSGPTIAANCCCCNSSARTGRNCPECRMTRCGANGVEPTGLEPVTPCLQRARNQARQASVSKRQNAGGRSMTL